jgi:DNA-binding response OmpR family regulator
MPDKTILVVDDEAAVLETITRILEPKRFNLLKAASYERAFQLIADSPHAPDLAIVDIALDGKNGVELATDLQILYPHVKVLFMSGLVGAELLKYHTTKSLCRIFLEKPFKASQLRRRVEEILSRQAATKTLGGASIWE